MPTASGVHGSGGTGTPTVRERAHTANDRRVPRDAGHEHGGSRHDEHRDAPQHLRPRDEHEEEPVSQPTSKWSPTTAKWIAAAAIELRATVTASSEGTTHREGSTSRPATVIRSLMLDPAS